MWDDPAIGIDWKAVAPDVNPLLSEKDGKHTAFDEDKNYFDLNGKWLGQQKLYGLSNVELCLMGRVFFVLNQEDWKL